jgi:hypothetical protein
MSNRRRIVIEENVRALEQAARKALPCVTLWATVTERSFLTRRRDRDCGHRGGKEKSADSSEGGLHDGGQEVGERV